MAKPIPEIFDEINADPKAIEKYKGNAALRMIFEYAFDPAKKFILPEGEPPYKPAVEPMGMTETNLNVECKKFHKLFVEQSLKPIKRESLFIGLIEHIHPTEAAVLIAVKDQKLQKVYPKITWKLVSDAGIIPAPPEKVKKESKST